MLAAAALRLAAIEALAPTAALVAGTGYPTLAGRAVFDSQAPSVNDLDDAKAWTPTLAVYSRSARAQRRGDAAALDDTEATATLEIVAELSVLAKDEDGIYVDAAAGSDADARMVLEALLAQVRRVLMHAPEGAVFRGLTRGIDRIDYEPFAVPELGLRWQRITMVIAVALRDDCLTDAAGLPEPLASLAAKLPAGSYAKARLAFLADQFAAVTRQPLKTVTFENPDTGDGGSVTIPQEG